MLHFSPTKHVRDKIVYRNGIIATKPSNHLYLQLVKTYCPYSCVLVCGLQYQYAIYVFQYSRPVPQNLNIGFLCTLLCADMRWFCTDTSRINTDTRKSSTKSESSTSFLIAEYQYSTPVSVLNENMQFYRFSFSKFVFVPFSC